MITYNHELYIKDALLGVLAQTSNFEIELIVADDCSTDKTESVVREIINTHPQSNIIKYTRHATNKGMMPNFIWALEHCKGEYIALCEGDDYWTDPYKLQKQIDFLEANPDYVICFHPVKLLERDDTINDDYLTSIPQTYETIEALAQYGNYIHTPSVVFTNILQTFPEQFSQTPVGDYFIYMLLAQHGKIGKLNDTMAVYRHQTGIWSNLQIKDRSLKMLFTLLLIRKVMAQQTGIISIVDNRIKHQFYALLPELTIDDLAYLRSTTENSKMLDRFLLGKIKYHNLNQLYTSPYTSILKILFKRTLNKLKLN